MQAFVEIIERARKRKGGKAALDALMPSVLSPEELLAIPDDRYLSMIAKVINQAGFRWSVVEKKWPQFEEAFLGFNIMKLSLLAPEQWEAYMLDTRIVRNWQKIQAVMENVSFVYSEALDRGSFASLIAHWPCDDQIGLMAYLKKNGSRLGGSTGQRLLRYMGKDAFILTGDVVLALQNAGLDIADNPTSKRDLTKVQQLMKQWHDETGLAYSHISKIAAFSTGVNYSASEMEH